MQFIHALRRMFVYFNLALDESGDIEYHNNLIEAVGFYCNPEFYFKRQELKNKKKHVNLSYQAELAKIKAGIDHSMSDDGMTL